MGKFLAVSGLVLTLGDWQARCVTGCGISYTDPKWRAECVVRCAAGDEEMPEWHTPAAADSENVNEIAPD